MPLLKLNNLLVSKSCLRFAAIDSQMSFFSFGDWVQKNNPKPSVKLAQSGRDLAQSVKLRVLPLIQY